ncbi:hypothetical protein [Brevibacillus laterosporus]|uniref:hypothetical protein n=1 Tax=Brevibacillus laterosporus TaxID=1465 RepID=UPI0018CDE500|nr:hypothetical protein [Brevibacillus laterosporus]MBG9790074.1 hypothetical protein [Brevibacillus laterosporus]
MFGFGNKQRKLMTYDVLLVKTKDGKGRDFFQVAFHSTQASDIMSMIMKLEKSKYNSTEYLGELGDFRIITHYEGVESINIHDTVDPDATPVQIQDFANIMLRRFELLQEAGKLEETDELAFFMGELTMLRDESFTGL